MGHDASAVACGQPEAQIKMASGAQDQPEQSLASTDKLIVKKTPPIGGPAASQRNGRERK